MNSSEIKKANRRALPKFLLVVALAAVCGGVVGFFCARYGLNVFSIRIKTAGTYFGLYIAPWVLTAMAVLTPVVALPLYRQGKRLLSDWDGEDEGVSAAAEEKLSRVIWLTSAALIISYFLLAANYSGGFSLFAEVKTTRLLCLSVAAFVAILIEGVIIQQKCVDAAKKTNPEKTVSVYDLKFQKKWMESCDEAEKQVAMRSAFRAYNATNTVCMILAVVLALCALVFEMGFLPSLVACVVWLVNQTAYYRETIRLSRAGSQVSL